MKTLTEILPPELLDGSVPRLEEYTDIPLIVHHVRLIRGQFGEYLRVLVSTVDDPEQYVIMTGASQPVEVLTYLKQQNLLPVQVTFRRVGRAIVVE